MDGCVGLRGRGLLDDLTIIRYDLVDSRGKTRETTFPASSTYISFFFVFYSLSISQSPM